MDHALIPIVIIPLGFVVQLVVQRGITSRYDYQCPIVASITPHRFGGGKFAKCPHCGVRSWVSPVPKP
jgi:hypothetical protein